MEQPIIHNCSPWGDKWLYEHEKIDDRIYKIRAFIPEAKAGDYIQIRTQTPPFQITEVLSKRDYAGQFTKKEMSKDSLVIIIARQITPQEHAILKQEVSLEIVNPFKNT